MQRRLQPLVLPHSSTASLQALTNLPLYTVEQLAHSHPPIRDREAEPIPDGRREVPRATLAPRTCFKNRPNTGRRGGEPACPRWRAPLTPRDRQCNWGGGPPQRVLRFAPSSTLARRCRVLLA